MHLGQGIIVFADVSDGFSVAERRKTELAPDGSQPSSLPAKSLGKERATKHV